MPDIVATKNLQLPAFWSGDVGNCRQLSSLSPNITDGVARQLADERDDGGDDESENGTRLRRGTVAA